MFIQNLQKSHIQELRSIIKSVPAELRTMARAERQDLKKLDLLTPGTSSYVISRGGAQKNKELKEVIDNLITKQAEGFYQVQQASMPKKAAPEVVKATMII